MCTSPTSSNPSNKQCSDASTPDLLGIVLKVIKEQFPNQHFSVLQRWGAEIRVNGQTAGSIIKNRWEITHWDTEEFEEDVEVPPGMHKFKIITTKRIVDRSIHASNPQFFDILKRDISSMIRYGERIDEIGRK